VTDRPAIAALFRPEAITLEAPIALLDERLTPDEWAYIRGAVPKRRAEFATGRVLARQALAALDVTPVSLPPQADRAPCWPAGVTGSISHTAGWCVVVLDRSPPIRSLGLDVETLGAMDGGVREQILMPHERTWLDRQPAAMADELALLFFSAKEAYYKCQYPLSGTMLDFQDVALEIDLAAGRFEASTLRPGLPAPVARLAGRFAWRDGRVMCGVTLTSAEAT
jgi:4'-phosphopantetheinyl transferase EntD